MKVSLEQKKYWSPRDQKLWDEVSPRSSEELLNLIQEYWYDLSGDNEFYFAIQLLRRRLNIPLDQKYFGGEKQEMLDDGYPEEEIVERKI